MLEAHVPYELGPEKKMVVARRTIDRFAADTIAKCRYDHKLHDNGIRKSYDMLSSFICNNDAGDEFLSDDTAVNLLLAGRDTNGTTLSWFFYLVCKNPRVEQKILDKLAPICFHKEAGRRHGGVRQ
uniref:Cytochrome P450 94A1 n=1 Tax=Aegilops tauschii TaxID=37682 RepID=M8BKH7_AEGTA